MDRILEPLSDANQVVDATTVKDFVAPSGARGFYISARTGPVYITFDGTAPSATNGLEIVNAQRPWYVPIPKSFKAFGSAASCPTSVLWVK